MYVQYRLPRVCLPFTVQPFSLDHLLVNPLSRFTRGIQLLGSDFVEGRLSLNFVPSIHPSYRDSSILSKCTRKPVCFPCFLYSFTDALTPVYSSSWFPPDLRTPQGFTTPFSRHSSCPVLAITIPVLSPPPTYQSCISCHGLWNIKIFLEYT